MEEKEIKKIEKIANGYIDDVLSGKVLACRFVILACRRHLDDLEHGKERGLYFNRNKAAHAVKFFSFLKLWMGREYKGKEFVLGPHFVFITWVLMGWYKEDGRRRFKKAYIECGRKSAKTSYAAGLGAYFFIADGEPGAQIFCAAVKKDQAKLVWTNIKNFTKTSGFANKITYFTHNLSIEATNSKCEPLSSDSKSLDGLDTHFASLDELHAHPTREVHDLIADSTGARSQPMILIITTAGFNQTGICYETRDYLATILKNVGVKDGYKDDSFFGIIYTLDVKKDWPELKEKNEELKEGEQAEDDWTNEDCWVKAVPGLIGITASGKRYGINEKGDPIPGYMTKLEDLQDKARIAMQMPSAQNNFRTKRLSVWTQQENRWLDLALWDQNNIRPVTEESCMGRLCYGGIDLSSTSDMTVWVMLFPDVEDKDLIDILIRVWCPEARLFDTKNKYREQYQSWKKQGYLLTTEGNAIDEDFIRAQIMADNLKFKIDSIAIDRGFQGFTFARKLDEELGGTEKDVKVAACGMGWVSMMGPCQELERKLLLKKLNHGGNPVLRWMADNISVKINPTGGGKSPNKALAIDIPLPTPFGWTTIENAKIGDILFDEKGESCKISDTTDIFFDRECYLVEFSDKTNIIADAGHLWRVLDNKPQTEIIITTKEMAGNVTLKQHQFRYAINNPEPLLLPEQDFILDPYLLGAWLGDGSTSTGNITGMDEEIFEEFRKNGFDLIFRAKRSKASTYNVKGLTRILYELGILNRKRIPEGYLRGSAKQRLSLLQGLMDTDGCCSQATPNAHGNGGYIQFINTNENIIDGVFELLASLGIKSKKTVALNAGHCGRNNQAWKISFVAYNNIPIFRLKRKFSLQLSPPTRISRHSKRQIVAITQVHSVPVRCINVDSPSSLFLAGKAMIPTHNSTSQGKIDGIVGILLGLDRLLRNTGPKVSVYDSLNSEEISKRLSF